LTDNFKIRFIASDSIRLGLYLDGGSLVEAAVDDLYLYDETQSTFVEDLSVFNIDVYPNPTKNKAYIKSVNSCKLKIYNLLGELILEEDIINELTEIDLSKQDSGIYYFEFYTDKLIKTKKVILE